MDSMDDKAKQKYKDKNYYFDSIIQENIINNEYSNNLISLTATDHLKLLDYHESNLKIIQKKKEQSIYFIYIYYYFKLKISKDLIL